MIPYRSLVMCLVGLSAVTGAYLWGRADGKGLERGRHEAALAKAVEVARETERKQQAITLEIQFEYAQAVQEIQIVRQIITREVPRYVTAEADSRCTVPVGFVELHDAAAAGRLPDATADPGRVNAASGVALSAVGSTVAANYGACLKTAARLKALQDWVRRTRGGAQ